MSDDISSTTLLFDCLSAFEAIPIASESRKRLKKLGLTPGVYAGNGSHILANEMAKIIRAHLNLSHREDSK